MTRLALSVVVSLGLAASAAVAQTDASRGPATDSASAGAAPPDAAPPDAEPPTPATDGQAVRPSPAALRALCDDAFAGLARETEATPAAIVPVDPKDPLARFVVDYLHWCLGEARGVQLVERDRLDLLLQELETQRLLGADDITMQIASLAGGRSVIAVAVHPVDPQTRDLTLRASRVAGAQVLFATAPVRVESTDLLELQRDFVTRNNRLVAAGLSAVLPGGGQLYNDEPLKAGLFIAAELALGAAALAYHLEGSAHETRYRRDRPEDVRYAAKGEAAWTTRNQLLWALGAVWAASIIDAAVSGGVPAAVDQRYRDRIGVGAVPGGAAMWLHAPF